MVQSHNVTLLPTGKMCAVDVMKHFLIFGLKFCLYLPHGLLLLLLNSSLCVFLNQGQAASHASSDHSQLSN